MFGNGYTPEDENGRPLPLDATPERRAARGEPFTMNFTVRIGDGNRHYFEATGRPVRRDDTDFGCLVVIRDITESSLRRLQDEFLARASHELRTPLTSLQASLQMLMRTLPKGGEDDTPARYAALGYNEARRLAALVDDLTDIARLETGRLRLNPQRLDLVPLLEGVVEVARGLTEDQRIELHTEGGPLWIDGDPDRLEQVILNLISNAIRYAKGSDHIDVRLRRDGSFARLKVQDYGPGIPAAELPNLFSRYYQISPQERSSQSGLGLGLFISKEIVTAHDGRIEARSHEGVGTTFLVWLPILEEPNGPATGT